MRGSGQPCTVRLADPLLYNPRMGKDRVLDYLFCIEEDIPVVRVVEGVAVGGVQPAAAQGEGLARRLQQLTLLTKI